MGFCRTNLFKRLESSGHAFVQSIERHLLRNYVYIHALANGLPVPVGTQEAELLDTRQDAEDALFDGEAEGEGDDTNGAGPTAPAIRTEADFRARAGEVYAQYAGRYRTRFKWVRSGLFQASLAALNVTLMADLTANAIRKTIETRDGSKIRYAEFFASKSKPIIDEIDGLLAKHYGFTAEELDFIVNYDIKYRLGAEEADDEE